jgi:hypothetical protein
MKTEKAAQANRKAALAGTQAQLRDSKGVSPARDAARRKGGAGIVASLEGGGTGKARKARRVPE